MKVYNQCEMPSAHFAMKCALALYIAIGFAVLWLLF